MSGMFGKKSTISNTETKIGSLQIQKSTYGGVIPVVFGTNMLAGNLLDYIDFTPIAHTTTTHSGGKGGGGVTQKDTSYTYTVAAIIGLCEGHIAGIGRVWESKNVYKVNTLYPGAPAWLKNLVNALIESEDTTLTALNVTTFFGSDSQQAWDYMVSKHPERALTYPKLAYVASPTWDLGSSASLPNYNYEMIGRNLYTGSLDALPKDIITAIMSDAQIGVGFPAEYTGDLTQYENYCIANGVLFSSAYTSQEEAQSLITDLCQASNAEPVWSQGSLKIVPYSLESLTANGVTYTPEQKEIPELTPDDFVYEEGEPPVKIKPKLAADQYNIQPVEILNRDNDYNVEPIKATDDPDITTRGPRQADSIEMHFITKPEVGQFAAQSVLQRQLYVPNQYEFTLTWRHCLLDPMDVVKITELDFLGLDKVPVRIVEITEDDEFNLAVLAEDCPDGVDSPALYPTQTAIRTAVNYNVAPGPVNVPVIFDPPPQLTGGNLIAWIAVSGQGEYWGGCGIWVSQDGNTYKRIGTVTAPARTGLLAEALPAGDSPDTTNVLNVDLRASKGQLISGTQEDAEQYNTLCYVDGELISYQTATLIAANQYALSYLVRGIYGTTIAEHEADSRFARLTEDEIFKYGYSDVQVGQTLYVKFTSFNIFGQAEQALDEVTAYQHTLTNAGKGSPNSSYQHIQDIPAAVWEITHNLNKIPSVAIVDNTGSPVMGTINYTSLNTLTVTFSMSIAGSAYLN